MCEMDEAVTDVKCSEDHLSADARCWREVRGRVMNITSQDLSEPW